MRRSHLQPQLAAAGAAFRERHGLEVVSHCADRRLEYDAVRDAVGLTDFSFVRSFRVPEEKGLDFLDGLVAGNVARIRYGRLLHTFLADEAGHLLADCYVANNDQEFLLLCESLISDDALETRLRAAGAAEAGLRDLTPEHALLSLDGFKAWAVAKALFGADVLGLPYLSIETYPFAGGSVRLFRAGRTSEFGYLLLAPNALASALFEALLAGVREHGGRLCGVDIHDDLRLEGRFFNIHAEGRRVRDPLVLGLQWMIDFEKTSFPGAEAIRQRRAAGLRHKIVGVAVEPGGSGLEVGARIFHEGRPVADVVAGCHSFVLNRRIGLAVFPIELAFSGLSFRLGSADGPAVATISMPPILPKSLEVKPDEM
jgi:aminomethyltransferase